MTDFTETQWKLVSGGKNTITSTKAQYYGKQSRCKGLAKFLLSDEARHYLSKGMQFVGVKFNSDLGAYWFVHPSKADLEHWALPLHNDYGDWALFSK